MNERIRTLMREAWQASEGSPPDGYEDFREELMDELQGVFDHFTKAVVREMCQVINADCELQYSEGVSTNLGGLNQARELIKQHFGVKE